MKWRCTFMEHDGSVSYVEDFDDEVTAEVAGQLWAAFGGTYQIERVEGAQA